MWKDLVFQIFKKISLPSARIIRHGQRGEKSEREADIKISLFVFLSHFSTRLFLSVFFCMNHKPTFKMTRQKKTTDNMFVPQTFNGERMVNVGAPNRNKTSNGTSPTPVVDTNNNNNNNTTATRTNLTPTTPIVSTEPSSSKSNNLDPTPQNRQIFKYNPFQRAKQQRYWSEANIVILIQLHKKCLDENNNQLEFGLDKWIRLTEEFNEITGNNRRVDSVMERWTKVVKKYNAERQWVILEQQRSKSDKIISCWTHYQFLNSYLSHLPIPLSSSINGAEKRTRFVTRLYEDDDEDSDDTDYDKPSNKKRNASLKSLFDTQRLMIEQTVTRQQSQIDMMKENYESMNKMNMKFVKVCERITARSETNEKRYLDLLEKYVNDKAENKNASADNSEGNNNNNNMASNDDHDEFLSPVTAETWLGVED